MTIGSQPLFPDARRSHLLRIIVVGVLVVVLQIPVLMIDGLIRERRARRDQAVEEVASKWGRRQAVTGPVLVVPYFRHWTEQGAGGSRIERAETNHATFLPESLTIRGRLQAEVRRRGIFSIPVYRATLQAEGAFTRPDLAQWGVEDHDVDWEHARVVLGIDDTRALRAPTAIEWNGARAEMVPGTGQFSGSSTGLHSEVAVPKDASRIGFSFPLELNGSAGAYWTPSGKITRVQLSSNWQSPSFQGNWLPLEHSISRNGFDAEWSVPYLGRNFPQAWRNDEVPHSTIEASRFGVDLIPSVDHYQMA